MFGNESPAYGEADAEAAVAAVSTLVGAGTPWLTTQGFLAAIDENMQKAMK